VKWAQRALSSKEVAALSVLTDSLTDHTSINPSGRELLRRMTFSIGFFVSIFSFSKVIDEANEKIHIADECYG
jgi:hypothetical protein